jgi:hypothetical protein
LFKPGKYLPYVEIEGFHHEMLVPQMYVVAAPYDSLKKKKEWPRAHDPDADTTTTRKWR